MELMHEFEEGFDRADFRSEFSPSPNLEGPQQQQPRDNVTRNFPTVSSSPPRARTNNDGKFPPGGLPLRLTLEKKCMHCRGKYRFGCMRPSLLDIPLNARRPSRKQPRQDKSMTSKSGIVQMAHRVLGRVNFLPSFSVRFYLYLSSLLPS